MLYLNEHRFIQKTYEDYRNGYLCFTTSQSRFSFVLETMIIHEQIFYQQEVVEESLLETIKEEFLMTLHCNTCWQWHNLTNTGDVPLKLYSIYAPPQHPFGTVHETKAEAMAAEHNH